MNQSSGGTGLEAVRAALAKARRLVVVGHVTPDSDCLGSMLAVAASFSREPGRSAAIELPGGKMPGRLKFMLDMVPVPRADDDWRASCETVVVVDTAQPSRTHTTKGWDLFGAGKMVINVDHHLTNTLFGTVNWVEDDAGSTSEMICRLLTSTGQRPSPGMASALYAGILADTAGFSLPNTTAAALEAAAMLVRAGADVGWLGEKLDRSRRKSDFNLLRVIYRNTKVVADGRIAFSKASHEEIVGAGCTAADIDDQVSVPRALNGIDMAMLFTEGRPGKIRINVRGEGDVRVLSLAQRLGGGGHQKAAGVNIDGQLDAVIERVLRAAAQYLDDQDP